MSAEQQCKNSEGNNICTGDPKINDIHPDQENRTDHDGDHGSLTDGSGDPTNDHVKNVHALSCFQKSQRCSTGDSVIGEGSHSSGEGNEQEASCTQSRVHEVLSKSAKQLFYNDDSENTAEDAEQAHTDHILCSIRTGKVQCKQKTGYGS